MSINRKKVYIALGLVLSTLVFPWSLIYYFLIFPMLYTGAIVPFFLWKNVFDGTIKDISVYSLLWKIPAVILLFLILNIGELSTFYILPYLPANLMIRILSVIFMIFILRVIVYLEMLWVWQPALFNNLPKIQNFIICSVFISTILACYAVISDIDRYWQLLKFLQN